MLLDSPHRGIIKKFHKFTVISLLRLRNHFSHAPITGKAKAAVSLTSYGDRLAIVSHTIESIAAGIEKPKRFILWVDDPSFDVDRYPDLKRLVKRGLEIQSTPDYGPHKKNYSYARFIFGDEPNLPLVTADDDILYPSRWLNDLIEASDRHPNSFVGYRAHQVKLSTDRLSFAPYSKWKPAESVGIESHSHFITGGAGAVFPPALVEKLRDLGDQFLDRCPRADDIWINYAALKAGISPLLIDSKQIKCITYPRSQVEALHRENITLGQNDVQLKKTFSAEDMAQIAQDPLTEIE